MGIPVRRTCGATVDEWPPSCNTGRRSSIVGSGSSWRSFPFQPQQFCSGATARAHGVGGKLSTAILAIVGLGIGLRALVSNSINAGDQSLLVKSLLRTRSLLYGDLSSAEAVSRPIGMYQRVCVRLHVKSGLVPRLDVTTVNESEANRRMIDDAAALINERLLGRR